MPLTEINGVNAGYTYGLVPNNPLTWDFTSVYGCACDKNFEGYHCSQSACAACPPRRLPRRAPQWQQRQQQQQQHADTCLTHRAQSRVPRVTTSRRRVRRRSRL